MKGAIVLIALILIGCGSKPQNGPYMYFYGDSITAYDSWKYATFISQYEGRGEVNKAIGGTALFHLSAAGTGATIYDQVMGDIDQWTENDMAFMLSGTNDGIYYQADPTNLAIYAQGLADILDRVKNSKVKIFYLATTLKFVDTPENISRFGMDNTVTQAYADLNAQAVLNANSPKIKLIDLRGCFTITMENSDSLHPNVIGNQQLFECYKQLKGVN